MARTALLLASIRPFWPGFCQQLLRERVELCLSEQEKAGARTTFFSKVKEELAFIPAQLKVIEYWQEKAVFERDGDEVIVSARRPVHPLGKCFATTALLAYIIVAKYADGAYYGDSDH